MPSKESDYFVNENNIYSIPPFMYMHVLDEIANVTRVETGPKMYVRQENEKVLLEPQKMVIIPPCHYCIICNPVVRNAENVLVYDSSGQIKLRHGDVEYRFEQDPFPLYPGEVLFHDAGPLTVVKSNSALLLKANRDFEEAGVKRVAGDEWLFVGSGTFIPRKEIEVVGTVHITTLTNQQYCFILNPIGEDGKPQLGKKKLVKGEKSFFLKPCESLEAGIQDVHVLCENEGLVLKARQAFLDTCEEPAVKRKPGERWMIRGPVEYIPPTEVEIVTKRYSIVLDENEGIYVRNVKSGHVRLVAGEPYILDQDEELWVKELPPFIEKFLNDGVGTLSDKRNLNAPASKSVEEAARAVTLNVPYNAAVQVCDYKAKKSRVVFGPNFIMLSPNEEFTELNISQPKRLGVTKSIYLPLGPDFCEDEIVVQTVDCFDLEIKLSYNWYFDVSDKSPEEAAKLFSVSDFIGDLCKTEASRIRVAVAKVNINDFLKNSLEIIQNAVLGLEKHNNLFIKEVDIQSINYKDFVSREYIDALRKRVVERQEAIERQDMEMLIKRSIIENYDKSEVEAFKCSAVRRIEAEAAIAQAKATKEVKDIEAGHEFEKQKIKNELEIQKIKQLSEIEIDKIEKVIKCIPYGSPFMHGLESGKQEFQIKLLQFFEKPTRITTNCNTSVQGLLDTAISEVPEKRRRIGSDSESSFD